MSVLWKTPIGVKLLWTAAGMLVLGGLIIRHIVNMGRLKGTYGICDFCLYYRFSF